MLSPRTLIAAVAAAALTLASSPTAVVAGGGSSTPSLSGPIKNVVLITLENRSFDHLLGYWALLNKDRGVEPLPADASNVLTATKQVVNALPNAQLTGVQDPIHTVPGVTQQLFGSPVLDPLTAANQRQANMAGFVDSFSATYNTTNTTVLHQAIDVFHPSKLPITVSLAEEFAVFDHWYAGVPGPTFPNRYFLMSATSNGNYNNGLGTILSGLPQKSLFQSVEDAGLSWKNYFGQVPTSIAFKDVRNIKDILTKLKSMDSFYSDAKKGTLPNFAQIDPILFSLPGVFANDNHPPHNVARGEALLKNIYEALRNGPQWNSTALIITYDEHGGFYDHVPPPQTGVPSPDDISANSTFFRFDRLGVRVPTIVVSPWVAKSRVVKNPTGAYASSYFEHSSVAATVKKLFNLPSYLTKRDAWAAPFDFLFAELSAPRSDAPAKLPDAPYIDLAMEVLDIENEFEELFQVFNAITTGTGI